MFDSNELLKKLTAKNSNTENLDKLINNKQDNGEKLK